MAIVDRLFVKVAGFARPITQYEVRYLIRQALRVSHQVQQFYGNVRLVMGELKKENLRLQVINRQLEQRLFKLAKGLASSRAQAELYRQRLKMRDLKQKKLAAARAAKRAGRPSLTDSDFLDSLGGGGNGG